MSEVAEVLIKAAVVIETRGWHRGDYVGGTLGAPDDARPVCVLGAINVATGEVADAVYELDVNDERADAALALARYLGLPTEPGDDLTYDIGDRWNDSVAESAEQVITALREAAKAAGGAS